MKYGQFCPIAKAAEILGERWTILIVRELLMGGRRFSDLQRGLGFVSPALLTARLKNLEAEGLVVRRRLNGKRGFEYWPTPACEALKSIVLALGEWSLCWSHRALDDEEFDIELLMLYLERSIDPSQLPGTETVIRFRFNDLTIQRDWWLLVQGGEVEVCIKPPGREVNVFFAATVRTMADLWMGDRTYHDAVLGGDLVVEGEPVLTRHIGRWLRPSVFAGAKRSPVRSAAATGQH